MHISLENIGKKYGKTWIFKGLNASIESGDRFAILGGNGSGKSTLLKIIAGQADPNSGSIIYAGTPVEEVYKKLSYCAPYIDLIEELTLSELLHFVGSYQAFIPAFPKRRILDMLAYDSNKWIKDYSSGMKQRVKIALALFTDVSLTLLDEPTSNLDEKGVEWYLEMMKVVPEDRTIVIASNLSREYAFCKKQIEITNYK